MYNLTVEGLHTYAVGASGVLVHNGCTKASAKKALAASEEAQTSAATVAPSGAIEYPLKRPAGVSDAAWQNKLNALNEGAAQGRAKVVYEPVRNGQAQRQARQQGMIKPGDDADHGLDLQFNGSDNISEIISTNSRVNRSVGSQGKGRLNYPDGTPISKFTEVER